MDYEKKYKEALEKARIAYNKITPENTAVKKLLEESFPELAESEDERIRKELVALFIEVRNREGNEGYWHDLKVADILAYLEKQKAQKPKIELIQQSWYMEGYNDCKFEKEPVWIISTGPGGPQYKLNPNREGGGSK